MKQRQIRSDLLPLDGDLASARGWRMPPPAPRGQEYLHPKDLHNHYNNAWLEPHRTQTLGRIVDTALCRSEGRGQRAFTLTPWAANSAHRKAPRIETRRLQRSLACSLRAAHPPRPYLRAWCVTLLRNSTCLCVSVCGSAVAPSVLRSFVRESVVCMWVVVAGCGSGGPVAWVPDAAARATRARISSPKGSTQPLQQCMAGTASNTDTRSYRRYGIVSERGEGAASVHTHTMGC